MAENSQAVIPDNLILVDGEIGVPSSTPSDAGKVLTVDSEGSPEWVTPSGGTQYTEGTGIDISEENVISVDTTVVATQNDLSGLQPSLTAGTNISISDNTISATDTTYTAGTGLSLTGTEFSVDTTVVATQTDLGNVRQVPSSTSADEDKVLTVNNSGVPEWADAPTELPSISGNGNKVLKVNAGATAVEWASESTELPTATSADNGKVLGVTDTSGTLSWVSQTPAQVNADWNAVSGAAQILNKPTIPTVDQSYSASSTNAQSGTAVADALSNVNQVPSSTSADETKVLTVNSSGVPEWANVPTELPSISGNANKVLTVNSGATGVEWANVPTELPASLGTAGQVLTVNSGATGVEWANASGGGGGSTYTAGDGITISNDTIAADVDGTTIGIDSTTKKIKLLSSIPTVDQTYNASSTNAQSGTAVAGALAAVPTKPIVAGSNITITDNANNITLAATDTTYTFSTGLTNNSGTVTVTNPVPDVTSSDGGKVLTAAYSGGVGSYSWVTTSGGGGGSGDKFTYHAPEHSIIFWFFENPSFDPSQDQTLSNISNATWTQLSSESNIWQLSLNSGSWANLFYDSINIRTLFPVSFDILSINFTGVTSISFAFSYAPVRHIHEVLGTITGSASYAFFSTTKLRGHVNIPEIATYYVDHMFLGSTLDSIHIGKLYYEYYPAIEGDPDLGEQSYNEYYTCSDCSQMFYTCTNLKFVDFGVAYLANCSGMFHYCINLQNASFVNACVFGSATLSRMFQDCKSLIWCPDIYFSHQIDQMSLDQYESMGNADHMFDGCTSLLRMPGISGTTSNCTNLSYMFNNCSSLVSIQWTKIADIGYYSYEDLDPDTGDPMWVTAYNVTNVQDMFNLCSNVIGGAANAYQQMSSTWTSISNHSSTFYVGSDVGRPEASQIPTSWGGSQS